MEEHQSSRYYGDLMRKACQQEKQISQMYGREK
jgi:hypothetical protein